MKKTLLAVLFSLFVIQPSFAEDSDSSPLQESGEKGFEQIVIAGGSPFGLRFSISGTLCSFIADEKEPCLVRPIKNSGEGISLVQSGMVDFALVQSDWLAHAKDGTSRFSESGKAENLLEVVTLSSENVLIAVSKTSGIKTISDFKNKKIDRGKIGTYRNVVSNVILDSAKLGSKDIKSSAHGQDDSIESLCKGGVDAAVFILSSPNPVLDTMMAQCDIQLIGLSETEISFISKNLKGFLRSEIPAETYWGQDDSIPTIGLYTVLITNKDSDKNLVKKMKDTVKNNIDKLSVMHPTLNKVGKEILK